MIIILPYLKLLEFGLFWNKHHPKKYEMRSDGSSRTDNWTWRPIAHTDGLYVAARTPPDKMCLGNNHETTNTQIVTIFYVCL